MKIMVVIVITGLVLGFWWGNWFFTKKNECDQRGGVMAQAAVQGGYTCVAPQ
jgi:hypothetical protein